MPSPDDEREPDDPTAGTGDDAGGTPPTPDSDPDRTGEGRDPQRDPPLTREEWRSEGRSGGPSRESDGRSGGDEWPGWAVYAYDFVTSALAVAAIGVCLFAVSGVWPPLVAVESTSMVPNMHVNDLVFVMEADRFPGEGAHADTGVVTARTGREVGYRRFDGYGDVVVYAPGGNARRTPIIHRAMFWVEAGENWYDEADPGHVGGADSCAQLRACPAPHAGFITKGDNNGDYDQAVGLSDPVRPRWLVGTAEFRIPGLGWLRLQARGAGVAGAAVEGDRAAFGTRPPTGTGTGTDRRTPAPAPGAEGISLVGPSAPS